MSPGKDGGLMRFVIDMDLDSGAMKDGGDIASVLGNIAARIESSKLEELPSYGWLAITYQGERIGSFGTKGTSD